MNTFVFTCSFPKRKSRTGVDMRCLAITEHHNVDSQPEVRAAAARYPEVRLIPSAELTVNTSFGARDLLSEKGIQARVVSMPSWELFERESAGYRSEVLPRDVPKISVEAATTFGWSKWVDASIGIDRFGRSGKGDKVLEHLGISPDAVAQQVEETIAQLAVK